MFGEMPDGYDSMSASEEKIIIYSCPICHDKINCDKENRFKFVCKCGYEWTTGLFGLNANVPINELVKLKYGIWKDYNPEQESQAFMNSCPDCIRTSE